MMYGKIRTIMIAGVILLLLAACSANKEENGGSNAGASKENTTSAKPQQGTLTLWGWDANYYDVVIEAFHKEYPDINFEITNVSGGDYLQKVQTTLASGGDLPDLMLAEIGWRGKIFELDIWEDLEEAPYLFDRSLVFDYLPSVTSNPDGKIIGLEQTVTPAAVSYRRDLAETYFGTSDPAELAAMFPTMDEVIARGIEVKEASGGEVFMFASIGDLSSFLTQQNTTPLLDGDVLNVSGRLQSVIETIVKVRDAGIVDKLEMWSPQWNASYAMGKHIFYPAANWSPQYVIKTNDPEGEGRWGMMVAPGGAYTWGGTTFGISKMSKNKELAWTFIEWLLLTEAGAEAGKTVNFYSPLSHVYEDPDFIASPDPFFAGQDVGRFFMEEIVPHIQTPVITSYDTVVNEARSLILSLINSDHSVDADEAMERLLEEVRNKLPGMEVR